MVLFDLDGTLVDTAPDLIATLNVIFQRHGLPSVPYGEARKLIGAGVRPLIERGLALEGRTCPPAEVDGMYRDYLAHYAEHIADASRPFPGLEAALDRLEAQGFTFAVCTNKLEWLSVKLLECLDLKRRFAFVCGQDTFGIAKPDPHMLLRTIEVTGGDRTRAVMIGDSEADIAAARAAFLPVVAVDFGYTMVPVRELAPDLVIGHFGELARAVQDALALAGGRAPA
jgi:phosphoglycolate phosphatase